MFPFIFRDEGEAGGGTGTAEADADSKSAGTDGLADSDAERGEGKNKAGETDKGKQTPEPTIESLTEQLSHLKSKLGKQGNELSDKRKESEAFRSIIRGLKENPNLALSKLAKKYGADISFKDKGEDPLEKALMGEDDEARLQILEERKQAKNTDLIKSDIMSDVKPVVDMIYDESMARKYPDYMDLQEDREHIDLMFETNQLTKTELYHWAARGRNIDAAIKAARVEAVEEYIKTLDKKAGEQIDTSGDRLANKQDIDFGDVAQSLSDLM